MNQADLRPNCGVLHQGTVCKAVEVFWLSDPLQLIRDQGMPANEARLLSSTAATSPFNHGEERVVAFAKRRPVLVIAHPRELVSDERVRVAPLYGLNPGSEVFRQRKELVAGDIPSLVYVPPKASLGLTKEGYISLHDVQTVPRKRLRDPIACLHRDALHDLLARYASYVGFVSDAYPAHGR